MSCIHFHYYRVKYIILPLIFGIMHRNAIIPTMGIQRFRKTHCVLGHLLWRCVRLLRCAGCTVVDAHRFIWKCVGIALLRVFQFSSSRQRRLSRLCPLTQKNLLFHIGRQGGKQRCNGCICNSVAVHHVAPNQPPHHHTSPRVQMVTKQWKNEWFIPLQWFYSVNRAAWVMPFTIQFRLTHMDRHVKHC